MRYLQLATLCGLFSLASAQGQPPTPAVPSAEVLVPQVMLVYPAGGTPFDREWAASLQQSLPEADMAEVARRLVEFQALWQKQGTRYLQAALAEIGAPFPYQQMQATLTVSDFPSMSAPLLIYVRNFLSTAQRPQPLAAFAEVVFHELLHTYLGAGVDQSPLMKKYGAEAPATLHHLHVMALEKYVLERLGETQLLAWVDVRYRTRLPASHKRAWQIVRDIEGSKAFVDELKQLPKSR